MAAPPPSQVTVPEMNSVLQSKAPPPATPTPPMNLPRATSGEAVPRTRDALIQYVLATGVQLTEAQISEAKGTTSTVDKLRAMARPR